MLSTSALSIHGKPHVLLWDQPLSLEVNNKRLDLYL